MILSERFWREDYARQPVETIEFLENEISPFLIPDKEYSLT